MIVDLEAFPFSDRGDCLRLQAEVQLHDTVAFCARQMVVVMVAFTEPEGVRSVRELDPVKHLHPHKLVDGAIDGCPSDARVVAVQLLEQLFRGKHGARESEANQVLCDGLPGAGFSFSELLERFVDPFLDVH